MDILNFILNLLMHSDKYIGFFLQNYGPLTYAILFLVIFLETGLVVTPFLPGDSLIFIAGTFAAIGSLNVFLLFIILFLAAVIGDSVNYAIGRYLGPKIFHKDTGKFLRKDYLYKTRDFFDRHGGKTIVFARFMPFIRTFAPFVAGIGSMRYSHFFSYNVLGGFLWVGICVLLGYFFGNITIVRENLTLFVILIVATSMTPAVIHFIRKKLKRKY